MAAIDSGNNAAGKANVDAGFNLAVTLPQPSLAPEFVGAAIAVAQVDDGTVTGTSEVRTLDVDHDYKLRVGAESMIDHEVFDYAAQNTGKFNMIGTTMVPAFSANGFSTNSTGIVTATTGSQLSTYAYFPILGAANLFVEFQASFTGAPTVNTIIDWGLFHRIGAIPFAPTDGMFFRLTSAGIFGVINHNSTETTTGAAVDFTGIDGSVSYTPNKKYQFIIQISERRVSFWIENILIGTITTPTGQGRPCVSASLPISIRHSISGGVAGAALSLVINSCTASVEGPVPGDELASVGNRIYGSYQGLSGGTAGSLASYANSANPTAAVPTNTTAALGTGLGGQFWETASLAVNTDGIICSFQVPQGSLSVQGRRLVIRGVNLWSYIQTVIVGGPFAMQYSLAFGHTAVSLATAEAAATKAPRRMPLSFDQVITAAQAVSTKVSQGNHVHLFSTPVFVNPGEFVALATKHVGTVGTSGVIAHMVTFDYGWE